MKSFCLILLLLSCSLILYAQQPTATATGSARITGRIVDSITQTPIEYATITLYALHKPRPIGGVTTTPKGSFSLDNLAPGSYTLTIGFIGYESRTIGPLLLEDKQPTLPLGNLALAKKAQALAAVTVTATRGLVENRIDKMVYNAEKDITSQGGVATDVLKKVPMVSVDVDGNVQLMGNADILFLINGKPSSIFGNNLADALQSIPASQIKSIEVITTPGAKYDAEGTGGIINIILKQNKLRGVNGNISLTGGSRLENGSLNLNARKDNIGLNAFVSGNAQMNSTAIKHSDRLSQDTATNTRDRLLQNGSSTFHRHGYESGLEFEWNISKHNDFSASLGYDNYGNRSHSISQLQQVQYADPTGDTLSDQYSGIHYQNSYQGRSVDWDLSYKRTFAREDQELNISANGSLGSNHAFYSQDQSLPSGGSTFGGSYSNNAGKDQETNFHLDYVQPFGEKVKLETGGRIQLRHITSASDVYTLDPSATGAATPPPATAYFYDTSQSNSLTYDRHVYAGYASLSFPLIHGLDVKAGLRYERTETNAGFSKSTGTSIPGYNTVAPSLILSHPFAGEQILKISYSRRLQRPDYGSLNPYINASDPRNITTGNPYLAPEIANNIDLTYSKSFDKGSALNIVLFYHRSDQDIQPYIIYYPSYTIGDSVYKNVSVNKPVNVGAENNYGLNIYGSVPLGPKITLRSNLSFFDRYITTGTLGGQSIRSFNYRTNLNATWQVTGTLVLEFFGNFNSSRNEIQGKFPSFTSYNFAFRKQIWNKKGSIAFTTTNPFANYVNQETAVTGSDFVLHSLRRMPYRSFGLNFTYKFGKLLFKSEKEEPSHEVPDTGGAN